MHISAFLVKKFLKFFSSIRMILYLLQSSIIAMNYNTYYIVLSFCSLMTFVYVMNVLLANGGGYNFYQLLVITYCLIEKWYQCR